MLGGKVAAMQARLDMEKQLTDAMNLQEDEGEMIQETPNTPPDAPPPPSPPPQKKRKVRTVKQKQAKMIEEPVHENLRTVLLVRFNNDEKAMETACFGTEEAMEGFEFYGEIGLGEQMLESTQIRSKKQSLVAKQLFVVWARMTCSHWNENDIQEQVQFNHDLLGFEQMEGQFGKKEYQCISRYGLRRISDDARYEFPMIYRRIWNSSHLHVPIASKKTLPLAGP